MTDDPSKVHSTAAGWTQDQLTQGLGLNDRQTVSDIENGKRAIKPDELLALSDLLNRDIEFFIDPFAVAGEAQYSWRAAPEVPEDGLDGFELKEQRQTHRATGEQLRRRSAHAPHLARQTDQP